MTFCLLSVIHKQRLKEYIYYMGFSLSFKVDSYDVNIGGWETKCCRQLLHFTFSLYPIAPKSRRLKRSSSQFFSQLPVLNENPGLICNDIYFFDFLVYIFLVLYFDIVLITQFSFWLLRNYLLINYMYQSICIYLYLSMCHWGDRTSQ